MKLKIFVNEVLWKSVTVSGDSYNPATFWPQIEADKQAGLLVNFNLSDEGGYSVRIEKSA
jgi:hypothetical protein